MDFVTNFFLKMLIRFKRIFISNIVLEVLFLFQAYISVQTGNEKMTILSSCCCFLYVCVIPVASFLAAFYDGVTCNKKDFVLQLMQTYYKHCLVWLTIVMLILCCFIKDLWTVMTFYFLFAGVFPYFSLLEFVYSVNKIKYPYKQELNMNRKSLLVGLVCLVFMLGYIALFYYLSAYKPIISSVTMVVSLFILLTRKKWIKLIYEKHRSNRYYLMEEYRK